MVVPPGHELLDIGGPITLAHMTRHPIITYETGYTGRAHIDDAFAKA